MTAVIYTHSHADHFGGVAGVLPDGAGDVPILAPAGFMEHAVVGERVRRRRDEPPRRLHVRRVPGTGADRAGRHRAGHRHLRAAPLGLIPPTLDITHTGQEETLDGVRIVFQLTPGTEAPAEMNFHFPDRRALCMAENATHNLHNLLTLRGALVRDPRIWSRYLDEAIELFAADGRRRVRLAPLADLGHGRASSRSCPSSATCTRTCTTRPCGC